MLYPTKSSARHRNETIAIVSLILTIFSSCVSQKKNESTMPDSLTKRYLVLQKIINRAKEITPLIQNETDRMMISSALDSMCITHAQENGDFTLPHGKQFVVVSVTRKEMPGYQKNDSNRTILMKAIPYFFYREHRVVIYVDQCVDTFSLDINANATCFIHEVFHSIQFQLLLSEGITFNQYRTDSELRFKLENQAWEFQTKLFKAIRPDLFDGTIADCPSCQLENIFTKEKISYIVNDRMIHDIVLYSICGEKYLKKLYSNH